MYRSLLIFFALLVGCSAATPPVAQDPPTTGPIPEENLQMAAAYSEAHAGDAVLVWVDGTLVLETYQNGYDATTPHLLASGTKTFNGVLAHAAIADGLLMLDQRVATVLPSWRTDSQKATITIRQLLHLTSGLKTGVHPSMTFAEALNQPLVHPPGEGFRYGSTGFQVFGAVLRDVLGDTTPTQYLQERLLDPIGAEVARWARTQGDPNLAGGAYMTARDWLRFGRLILNDGRWAGAAVVPPGLIDRLTTASPVAPGYGLSVWLNAPVDTSNAFFQQIPRSVGGAQERLIYGEGPPDVFMAAGLFNQRLYIIPSRHMVVVRLGRPNAEWQDSEFLARLLDGTAYEAPPRPPADPEMIANLYLLRLSKDLDLTSKQEQAVRPILVDHITQLRALRPPEAQRDALSRRARWRLLQKMRRLNERTAARLRTVLTPQQMDAYEAWRTEQRERLRERQGK
ncbi:serine hydrolase [Salisaeta longa]|uniref:serine hydrolase n=1 Tax=Salisaeta longa TaxID=503170 RepID=UPI00146A5AF0|nr:serine hydrolase [Salisaeta longa]